MRWPGLRNLNARQTPGGYIGYNRRSPQADGLFWWFGARWGAGRTNRIPDPVSGIDFTFGNQAAIIDDGEFGAAVSLDGVNDYLAYDAAAPTITATHLTMTALISGNRTVDDTAMLGSTNNGDAALIYPNATDHLGYKWTNTTSFSNWEGGPVIPVDTPCLVAVAIEPTQARAVVISDASGYEEALNVVVHPSNTIDNNWAIGSDSRTARWFDGLIFDARVYLGTLTADELWQLWDPATRWELYPTMDRKFSWKPPRPVSPDTPVRDSILDGVLTGVLHGVLSR